MGLEENYVCGQNHTGKKVDGTRDMTWGLPKHAESSMLNPTTIFF